MVLVQVVVSGLLIGGIYMLLAAGITLIFGVLKVVNFAHGELLMLGMYIALLLNQSLGLHPYASIAVSGAAMFLFGMLLHWGLIRWTISGGHTRQMVLTLGVSTLLQGAALMVFSGNFQSARVQPILGGAIEIGGVSIGTTRLATFIIALAMIGLLLLFLDRTRMGTAIRAVAMDSYAATLMGIKVERIYLVTMGIGAALAGVAGAILLPIYAVYPTISTQLIMIAFIVVVLGGLGSVVGAMLGGLTIGVVEALAGYFAGAALSQIIVFVLFILILLVRPRGIMKAEAA